MPRSGFSLDQGSRHRSRRRCTRRALDRGQPTSSVLGWFQRRCCNRLRSATARGLVGPESAPADHSGSPKRCAVPANYGSAELHDGVDSWAGGCRRHLSLRNPPPAVVLRNRCLDKAAHRAHCPVSTIRCDMAHRAHGRSRRQRAVTFQCGSCRPLIFLLDAGFWQRLARPSAVGFRRARAPFREGIRNSARFAATQQQGSSQDESTATG